VACLLWLPGLLARARNRGFRRDAARDRRPVNAGGESKKESGDPHLRSTGEVIGYSIHANDGDIGHVDDFMIDDNDWIVRYVVITRSWWPGEEGLARAGMDRANQLDEMRAFVPLSRDLIKDAPDWDDAQPVTRAFEERLYDYYWLRRYWPIET
jgi:hypothetical protein